MKNKEQIGKGFDRILPELTEFVIRELKKVWGDQWWSELYSRFYDEQKKYYLQEGTDEELIKQFDIALCLNAMNICWQEVFKRVLYKECRTWVIELKNYRDKYSHKDQTDFEDADAERCLDTMTRFCDSLNLPCTDDIRAMYRKIRYGSEQGSTMVLIHSEQLIEEDNDRNAVPGLPSWRIIMEPHPDVAQGLYRNAEFAADLSLVARHEAKIEYQDPIEFFNRTYITEGMRNLLSEALKRVNGIGGEPVIQLKTAFGGGKTHTMLALYHLLRGEPSLNELPQIRQLLDEVGVNLKEINIAVIVGTAMDPAKPRRPPNMPGITINTLWGDIAAQLAYSVGKSEIYNLVKTADAKHVSPGSETLINLFNQCGPCLILIDELVAYGKKLYGTNDLVSGTFDNMITFIQELTEAARACNNCLVVASIPESDIELGGDAGKITLEAIEHTFGRMETVWKPVAANEGYEVVRRRLFLNCKDESSRDNVCDAFYKMYQNNPKQFPVETKDPDYRERLKSCYPIHPEIFDRLYEDWATLESFQKTRGVLRFMASVIHDLWMKNDASPMIMPGSISLDNPDIKNELTRYLNESWNSIVDNEVDGIGSAPYQLDKEDPRMGACSACRRVARTIFLGSAPSEGRSNKGISANHIRLGVMVSNDNVATINDAITKLGTKLTYLYNSPADERYWFDTSPTLKKVVQDIAHNLPETEITDEIKKRLLQYKAKERIDVHVCPRSIDVPDEQKARLVLLPLESFYSQASPTCDAVRAATNILENHGTNPRVHKNMVVFLAPDSEMISAVKKEVALYLAWKRIVDEADERDLTRSKKEEAVKSKQSKDKSIGSKLNEAYPWLLIPTTDSSKPHEIFLDARRLSSGMESFISRALNSLISNESLNENYAPSPLKYELDNKLWIQNKDISIKEVWNTFTRYCYMPRLKSFDVLANAISKGMMSGDYFAIAGGKEGDKYLDLRLKCPMGTSVNLSDLLVKKEIAEEFVKSHAPEPKKPQTPENPPTTTDGDNPPIPTPPGPGPTPTQTYKRFHLSKNLDLTRVNRDVGAIVDEILSHLQSIEDANITIYIDIEAESEKGIPKDKERTIKENCTTLKVDQYDFY